MNTNICTMLECLSSGKAGFVSTRNDAVRVFRYNCGAEKQPFLYTSSVVFICQGKKVGYLQGRELHYNRDNYLVVAAPLPLDCITIASEQEPLLGFVVDIDHLRLQNIWAKLDQNTLTEGIKKSSYSPKIAQAVPWSKDIDRIIHKLLFELLDDERARILSDTTISELYYYLLKGEQAHALFSLADRGSHFTRIAQVLVYIEQHLSDRVSVKDLADQCSMSLPTFHRYFKQVTDDSPVQYIKRSRLSRAKNLIEEHGMNAGAASQFVGYDSPSQFSREFKRFYGSPPSKLK